MQGTGLPDWDREGPGGWGQQAGGREQSSQQHVGLDVCHQVGLEGGASASWQPSGKVLLHLVRGSQQGAVGRAGCCVQGARPSQEVPERSSPAPLCLEMLLTRSTADHQ